MSLAPEDRVLLTDALRPPAGCRVDQAIGTTYSLDLTALLLAPLSFALGEVTSDGGIDSVDPVRLLEAVRRHAEHTTVFCQAGAIHVPGAFRGILTFVEDSVVEVSPPNWARLFHPKVWVLRFIDQEGTHRHRVIVLSRNLTFDRSWDTALVLDEAPDGTIDPGPMASFLEALPGLGLRELARRQTDAIHDVSGSLRGIRLAVPAPFTGGTLVPIGITPEPVWPFPGQVQRLLAISPFLTKQALSALGEISSDRALVSRPESLDLVGAAALEGWRTNVLQQPAEADPADDVAEAVPALDEFQRSPQGLHAKTFVLDLPAGESVTVTGSANLTRAPWGGNVEFDAVLTGPTAACGVAVVLDGRPEAPGLSSLLQTYTVTEQEGIDNPAIGMSEMIERFHREFAESTPLIQVTQLDDERAETVLVLDLPENTPGSTAVWLASLPAATHRLPLDARLAWTIARSNVTPFVAVETTAGDGQARVTRRCVIKADLAGDLDGRRQDAVFSVLRSKEDVLRYLVFLLGDPSYDALFSQMAGLGRELGALEVGAMGSLEAALLEPLVRATGRDEDALARVASLVDELRSLPNGGDLVPDDFDALWDVVWQVHGERKS